jgi:hypothetical protein
VGGVGDWEIAALRDLYGERWEIERVSHMEIRATPRGDGEPVAAMSSAVLRSLINAADWQQVMARYRPAHRAG